MKGKIVKTLITPPPPKLFFTNKKITPRATRYALLKSECLGLEILLKYSARTHSSAIVYTRCSK